MCLILCPKEISNFNLICYNMKLSLNQILDCLETTMDEIDGYFEEEYEEENAEVYVSLS